MADGSLYDSVYNAYVEEEALKCGLKSEEAARDALKRDLEALEPELAKETPALKAALASFSRKCTRDVAALEDRFNRLKLRTETLSSGGHEREKMAAALLAEAQAAGAAWAGRSKQAYAAFLALAPAAAAMQPLLGQLQTLNEQEAAVRAELAAFDVRAAELQADLAEATASATAAAATEAGAKAALDAATADQAAAATLSRQLEEATAAATAEAAADNAAAAQLLREAQEQEATLAALKTSTTEALQAHLAAAEAANAAAARGEAAAAALSAEAATAATAAEALEAQITQLRSDNEATLASAEQKEGELLTARAAAEEAVMGVSRTLKSVIKGPSIPGLVDPNGAVRPRLGGPAPPSKHHIAEMLAALGLEWNPPRNPVLQVAVPSPNAEAGKTLLAAIAAWEAAAEEDGDGDADVNWGELKQLLSACSAFVTGVLDKTAVAVAAEAGAAAMEMNKVSKDMDLRKSIHSWNQNEVPSTMRSYLQLYGLYEPAPAIPDTPLDGTELAGLPFAPKPDPAAPAAHAVAAAAEDPSDRLEDEKGVKKGEDDEEEEEEDDMSIPLPPRFTAFPTEPGEVDPDAPATMDDVAAELQDQAFRMEPPPPRLKLSQLRQLVASAEAAAEALAGVVNVSLQPLAGTAASTKTAWEAALNTAAASAAAADTQVAALESKAQELRAAAEAAAAAATASYEAKKKELHQAAVAPVQRASAREDELDAALAAAKTKAAAAAAAASAAAATAKAARAAASAPKPPSSSSSSSSSGPSKKRPRLSTDSTTTIAAAPLVSSKSSQPAPAAAAAATLPAAPAKAVSSSQPARPAAAAGSFSDLSDVMNTDDGVFGNVIDTDAVVSAATSRHSSSAGASAAGRPGGGSGRPSSASAAPVPMRASAKGVPGAARTSMGSAAARSML